MQTLLTILQIFLALCNSCIMIYVFVKFLKKPHTTLEELVNAKFKDYDIRIRDIEESLTKNSDKFREQKETNAVFKKVMLLFANFEIAFCLKSGYEDTGDLKEAKEELQNYLSR